MKKVKSKISSLVNWWLNGSGIAEGRDLEEKSFNLAQMPNESKND